MNKKDLCEINEVYRSIFPSDDYGSPIKDDTWYDMKTHKNARKDIHKQTKHHPSDLYVPEDKAVPLLEMALRYILETARSNTPENSNEQTDLYIIVKKLQEIIAYLKNFNQVP